MNPKLNVFGEGFVDDQEEQPAQAPAEPEQNS